LQSTFLHRDFITLCLQVGEKGLAEECADRIGALVQVHGEPRAVLKQLTAADSQFMGHGIAKAALESCAKLFSYLEATGSLQYISFDLSLARGLDYYTGVIYEAVLTDPDVAVGSIAAGGRYDNLVGMFSPSGTQVPCVGVSIGIERVFTIMEARAKAAGEFKKPGVTVLVASVGKGMTVARLQVCAALWNAGLSAETLYSENPKMGVQFDKAFEEGIPFMVVLGEDEVARGTVKVKHLATKEELEVPRDGMVQQLVEWGAQLTGAAPEMLAAAHAGAGAALPVEAPAAPVEQ
jgi:histidyl-tRNA synthetase